MAFDFEQAKEEISHPIPADVKGHYLEREKQLRAKKRAGGEEVEEGDDDEQRVEAIPASDAMSAIRVANTPLRLKTSSAASRICACWSGEPTASVRRSSTACCSFR